MKEFRAKLDGTIDALTDAFETGLMSDAKSAVHALTVEVERLIVPVDEFAVLRSYVEGARRALSVGSDPQERAGGALGELIRLRRYLDDGFGQRPTA